MKFEKSVRVQAPVDDVFKVMSDLDTIKRNLPSTARLAHVSGPDAIADFTKFQVHYQRAGRDQVANLKIKSVGENAFIKINVEGNRLGLDSEMTLSAQSATVTSLATVSEVSAKSMLGRILLQSLRAGRSRIDKRLEGGLGKLARMIEDDYRKTL